MKTIILSILLFFSANIMANPEITASTSDNKKEVLSNQAIFKTLQLRIEEIDQTIKIKFQDIYILKGDERALVGIQMLELERQINNEIDSIVSLVLEMKEESEDVSEQLKTMHGQLNGRNKYTLKIYKFIVKGLQEAQSSDKKIKVGEAFSFEQKNNHLRSVAMDFLLSYQHIIELKTKLSIDTEHNKRVFSDVLLDVSSETAARLRLVSNQVDIKKNEIAELSEESKKAFTVELKALVEKKQGLTSALTIIVNLMKEYQLDTTVYSQLLITSSGTINQQIFDKNVISGLLVQWVDEFEKWVALNASNFIVKLLIVLLILFVFRLLSLLAAKMLKKALEPSKVKISKLLFDFFVSAISRVVMLIGVLIALSQTGVELGPLLAGLGVLGFIVGFALQGVLSNFASGMMILIYRPYDVGDVIEIKGTLGTVKDMNLVSTTMLSFSNERLIIPNNTIWGDTIKNITSEKERRIDLVFKISFEADVDQVEAILNNEVARHEAVLVEPAAVIKLHKQHETHLEYIVRPWVKTSDYWDTYWDLNKSIKKRFDKEGVPRLFPYAFLKSANEGK